MDFFYSSKCTKSTHLFKEWLISNLFVVDLPESLPPTTIIHGGTEIAITDDDNSSLAILISNDFFLTILHICTFILYLGLT